MYRMLNSKMHCVAILAQSVINSNFMSDLAGNFALRCVESMMGKLPEKPIEKKDKKKKKSKKSKKHKHSKRHHSTSSSSTSSSHSSTNNSEGNSAGPQSPPMKFKACFYRRASLPDSVVTYSGLPILALKEALHTINSSKCPQTAKQDQQCN
jgi:hypothetical protein